MEKQEEAALMNDDVRKVQLYEDSFSQQEAQKSKSSSKDTAEAFFDSDSVYFVNRRDKTNRIVIDSNLERGSPTWDEWTSEESSTISVLCASDVNKEPSKSDAEQPTKENLDFPASNSFDYLNSSQPLKTENNETTEHKELEKDKYNQKLKQTTEEQLAGVAGRQYSGISLGRKERDDSDSAPVKKEYLNISAKKRENEIVAGEDRSRDTKTGSKYLRPTDHSPPSYSRSRDLSSPSLRSREISPSFRARDYSPSFRTASPFRTHSPNYAIDAYLGLKDKDNKQDDAKKQQRDDDYDKYSRDSYDRRRPRNMSGRTHESDAPAESATAADIKQDLCSDLMTINNAAVTPPETRRYSEEHLTGLKRLTAVNNEPSKNYEDARRARNPFPETTDDSKSWYQNKLSAGGDERTDSLRRRSPRSKSPVSQDQDIIGLKQTSQHKDVGKQQLVESELPGFLAKTSSSGIENRLEKDIHFESEFPTFSAYLKRTYGQTYQYRNRDNSSEESNQRIRAGEDKIRHEDNYQRSSRQAEMDQVNVKDKEYSLMDDKLSSKEQSQYRDVEHKSRKTKYDNGQEHIKKENQSFIVHDKEPSSETKPFLREELVYESSGVPPAHSELSTSSSKQVAKNSVALKCKVFDQREASPTIDLLQQSFESLQSAINNKEIDLSVPHDNSRQDSRRFSPSPERFPDPDERLSDSSRSRSRSRTKKRTIQSQPPRSRDSSQKLRLKDLAPTFYEAKYNSGHESRIFEPDGYKPTQPHQDKIFSSKNISTTTAQNSSPSLSEIEGIYKGLDQENFGNLQQQKYFDEKYPMDFNDEDINIMKKFIHHKNEELYMDVETFKKLYVQNRVMEMKRETSLSRRSSINSNMTDQELKERSSSEPHYNNNNDSQGYSSSRHMMQSPRHHQSSDQYHVTNNKHREPHHHNHHTQIEYESPSKKNVGVQMQVTLQLLITYRTQS